MRSRAIDFYVGPDAAKLRRQVARLTRPGTNDRVTLYHHAADRKSRLFVRLLARWEGDPRLTIDLRLVNPEHAEFRPAPELRDAHDALDARRLANWYGLTPSSPPTDPQGEHRALISLPQENRFALACRQVAGTVAPQPRASMSATRLSLHAASQEQRRHGHFAPGMALYRGEWFPVDRIESLWQRLTEDGFPGLEPPVARAGPRWAPLEAIVPPPDNRLVAYLSFRSPYSYLAAHQLLNEPAHGKVDVRCVLPMVMRGLQVPWAKRRYIALDAAREARRLGIPFGRLRDPLGKGIHACLAIAAVAKDVDLSLEFFVAVTKGIWSAALDVHDRSALIDLAAEVGVSRAAAARAHDEAESPDASWRHMAEQHRNELTALGHWGVPVFKWGTWSAWGQDRLPLLRRVQATVLANG